MLRRPALVVFCALVVCAATAASAQGPEHVAVVINELSPDSQRIGEHYARTRRVPDANVLRVRAPIDEEIDRATFETAIEQPLSAAIRRAGLQDRILYLVLTKGIPLRIRGTTGLQGTQSSVDSELTLLYRRLVGTPAPPSGAIDNPYYLGTRPLDAARPFSHREYDIYLVTRLDAFTVDEALALIDRGQATRTDGRIVLDQRAEPPASQAPDEWLSRAAERLAEQGHGERVMLERTPAAARDVTGVLGRYAWGAADPAQRTRRSGVTFAPGGIAATVGSFDARTFREPPDNWQPVPSQDKKAWFEGSSDGLIGDLIRDGATGVSGQAGEAFVRGAFRPEILFPAYLAGFNLAEAFYLAQPVLSWQSVVIGDPLCAPFGRKPLTRSELEDEVDASTGLPGAFSKRRIAAVAAANRDLPPAAITAMVRATTLLDLDNKGAAAAVVRESLATVPKTPTWLLLAATLLEQAGDHDTAIATYRQLLDLQPSNVVALNNIAFALAQHKGAPAEALPFARRAFALAPRVGSIVDTLAWTEHLSGNHQVASKLLEDAIRLSPREAEIHLHAAIVYEALGLRERSAAALNEALRIDPQFESREDVRQLRARLRA